MEKWILMSEGEEQNINNMFLNRKLNELAAMLKEKHSGSMAILRKVKAKFCLQEGVSYRTVGTYITMLRDSGLLVIYSGKRGWRYNPKEEWDLFKVTISYDNINGGE
jgi:hypothetical protein